MALTDSDKRLKRIPDNDRDKMKVKADRVLMADVSGIDLDILGKYSPNQDIDTIRTVEPGLSTGKQGITDQEIRDVLSGKIKEPTGIHKKK
tara:strand:- start:1203 stop:1475 length:273 start_codon:yes stop_codon:yes gene_type:complete